jgi:hypothetical protein
MPHPMPAIEASELTKRYGSPESGLLAVVFGLWWSCSWPWSRWRSGEGAFEAQTLANAFRFIVMV